MDIEKILDKAIELFGYLPDPEVYPMQFKYLLKLAHFELNLSKEVL